MRNRGSSGDGMTAVGVVLLLAAVFLVLFTRALTRSLNHDEHQFLAPAVLLGKEGLLPYRDYPLFHLPNLTLIYGAVVAAGGHLVFWAKASTAICSWATALILVWQGVTCLPGRRWMILSAAVIVALFTLNPLFAFTAGRTWNHELPTFMAVLALVLVLSARERGSATLLAMGGFVCALAVGGRLTILPLLGMLGVLPLAFFSVPWRGRAALVTAYVAGALLGLAPSLIFFALAPEQFLFGNFEFPRLALLDPENTRIQKTLQPWRKVRFFFKEIVLPNWPLFLSFAACALPVIWRGIRSRTALCWNTTASVLAVGVLLVGCFAPSRYQQQHYFVLLPFLTLAAIHGFLAEERTERRFRLLPWLLCAMAGFAAIQMAFTFISDSERGVYASIKQMMTPADWFPNRARLVASEIANVVPAGGRVLTLAPVLPLEAKLRIYPPFATGVFAWRNAQFVPPERRSRLKLIAPEDLPTLLERNPPAAILTGVEDAKHEEAFVTYAKSHDFREVPLGKGRRKLWLPPPPP